MLFISFPSPGWRRYTTGWNLQTDLAWALAFPFAFPFTCRVSCNCNHVFHTNAWTFSKTASWNTISGVSAFPLRKNLVLLQEKVRARQRSKCARGLEASSTFAKKSLDWNVALVTGWQGVRGVSKECQAKSLLLPFSTSVKYQENYNNCCTLLIIFFKQKEILLVSKTIQACQFTLLRVYLALLSISPAFLDSSDMVQFTDRDFSWDLMCALYNILH